MKDATSAEGLNMPPQPFAPSEPLVELAALVLEPARVTVRLTVESSASS